MLIVSGLPKQTVGWRSTGPKTDFLIGNRTQRLGDVVKSERPYSRASAPRADTIKAAVIENPLMNASLVCGKIRNGIRYLWSASPFINASLGKSFTISRQLMAGLEKTCWHCGRAPLYPDIVRLWWNWQTRYFEVVVP